MSAKIKRGSGLKGITTLMNEQYLSPDAEITMANGSVKAPQDEMDYNDEINKLSEELGIGLDSISVISAAESKRRGGGGSVLPPPAPRIGSRIEELDDSDSSVTSSRASSYKASRRSHVPEIRSRHTRSRRAASSASSVASGAHSHISNKFLPKPEKMYTSHRDLIRDEPPMRNKTARLMTEEQRKKDQIHGVIENLRVESRNTFSTDMERIQDMKTAKIEQIACLKVCLQEQGIDVDNIPSVSIETPVEEIDAILNLLNRKNNRSRYSSMAEEFISGFAEILETVFDGTRRIPGLGWKPDYTGYSSTLQVKLHRIRYETSQVVGGIVERHHISPLMRIGLELIPSLALYPKGRDRQKKADVSTSEFNNIRKRVDNRNSFDDYEEMKRL